VGNFVCINMSSLPKPPFLVKSLYPYESDHPDDLAFQEGQTIQVEVIEDEDWFTGSFVDDESGKSGMFPRNFVEVVPSKTTGRRPPPVPPSAGAAASTSEIQDEPLQKPSAATVEREPEAKPAVEKEDVSQKLKDVSISDKQEVEQPPQEPIEEPEPIKEPEPVKEAEPEPVKKVEPEVEAPKPKKKSAFQDRIAAFNNQNDAPPTPLFQQPKPRSFVNKPYVPPPSSYVPTAPKSPPPTGVNKTAPPPPPPQESESTPARNDEKEGGEEEEEESVPKMSLKDRIKMLEQQQKEEQERMEAAAAKKKQKAKAKKETAEPQEQIGDLPEVEPTSTGHSDTSQPRRSSSIDEPRRVSIDEHSSEAPETVYEEQEQPQQPPPPPHQPHAASEEHADREDEDEEDEEESSEEEDEEEAKRIALRERMAKISGGMGMNLGMILPGAGLPPASKPKTKKKKKHAEEEGESREVQEGGDEETPVPQPAAVPVMPFADPNAIKGLGKQPPTQEDEEVVEHREPEHGTSSDYEDDAESRTIREEQEQSRPPPPPPRQERISISSEEDESGKKTQQRQS
jgi:hypothetical protein